MERTVHVSIFSLLNFFIPVLLFALIYGGAAICLWRIFKKAGKPGWIALMPFYNYLVLLQIIKKPTWWVIWLLLSIIFSIIKITTGNGMVMTTIFWVFELLYIAFLILTFSGLSRAFGKDGWFTVGLFLLPYVFIPILAFGGAKYIYINPQEPLPGNFTTQLR